MIVSNNLSMRLSLSHPIGLIFVFGFLLRLSCATAHRGTSRSWREKVGALFHDDAGTKPVRTGLWAGAVIS